MLISRADEHLSVAWEQPGRTAAGLNAAMNGVVSHANDQGQLVSDAAQAAEARRLAVVAMLAALDDRHKDLPALLADADRETLVIVIGGLVILASTIVWTPPADSQAALREQLADCALAMAAQSRS